MTLNTHRGTELYWAVDKNSDNDWTINCRDGNNAIVDLTPNTFTLEIFSDWGTAALKTLTQGDGLTNGGANGALTIALAKAISSIKMSRPEYKYRISYLTAGKPATFLYGKLMNSPESVSSPSATSLSATINMGGVNVSATITLASVTSAMIATALGAQTANTVYAGPSAGAAANPAFRALVAEDVPDISATYLKALITANRQTASYTLVLTDAAKLVELNVATANNLTVPPNSSVAFSIGTQILISQYGAGQTTVVAGTGVTIRSASGQLKLTGQYSAATLVKIATDEWYLFGDITV